MSFDQSSPVQPISEFRGASTSVTEEDDGRTEILVSNIGYQAKNCISIILEKMTHLLIKTDWATFLYWDQSDEINLFIITKYFE